ncbi:MAG: hypothetical protein R2856_26755 [Caldilineaceae bacterium]
MGRGERTGLTGGAPLPPARVDAERIAEIAAVLRSGEPAAFLLSGKALLAEGTTFASRIGHASGARVMGNRLTARIERGAGRPEVERVPYPVDQATAMLSASNT